MKIVGALFIIVAFGYIGMIVGKNFRRRPEELRTLQGSLQLLETEIVYGATPLPEAFERIARQFDNHVGEIFKLAKNNLWAEVGDIQRAWSKALNEQFQHLALTKKDLEVLQSLGRTLGISDRDDQKKHLRLAMEKLKVEEKNAAEEAQKYASTFNYLGFLCGLTLVIIIF